MDPGYYTAATPEDFINHDPTDQEKHLVGQVMAILRDSTTNGKPRSVKLGTIVKKIGCSSDRIAAQEVTRALAKARFVAQVKHAQGSFFWQNNSYKFVPDGRDAQYDGEGKKIN